MSYTKRRVVGLQKSLSPQQAVLLWMEEAHRFDGMLEYAKSLLGQPLSAYPIQRLRDQAAIATRAAMRGGPRKAVEKAEALAERDALFLFYLHQQVNHKVLDEQRGNALEILFLAERLNAMVRGQEVRMARAEGGVAEEADGAAGGAGARKAAAQWAEWAGRLLRDLHAVHSAAVALGERYFGGRQILFRESAEALGRAVESAEGVMGVYNEIAALGVFGGRDGGDGSIDLEVLRAQAAQDTAGVIAYLVDMAKAEALVVVGQPEAAAELLGRHV